nr:uncharacterized protein LOC127294771 [Lolium perenne]
MVPASIAAALEVPPNSKMEADDRRTAGPYSCRGQTTHPCEGHQNGGGAAARAASTFSSAPSIGAAGPARSQSGTTGARGARGAGRGARPFAGPAPFCWTRRRSRELPAMAARTVASCTVAVADVAANTIASVIETAPSSNSMPAVACDKALATFVLL